MKEWTETELKDAGYDINNAKIESIDLSMTDHGILCLEMGISGSGWGCVYGGHVLGKGYLGADEFIGNPSSIEYIMRIMDVIGVEQFNNAKGKIIRVANKGWGSSLDIIGNVILDKWFDAKSFFTDKQHKQILP